MTTPMTKQFEIGPVVTVLRGDPDQIFCTLQQLNEILGFMTGDVPTFEANEIEGVDSIEEAMSKCGPHLAGLFPELAAEPDPGFADTADPSIEAEIVTWLVGLGVKHHAPFTVTQLPDIQRAAAAIAEPETTE